MRTALLALFMMGCASSGGTGVYPAGDTHVEETRDAENNREVYARGKPRKTATPTPSGSVNGYAGQDCVRPAKTCGRAPEDAPPAMVLLRVE